MIFITGDCHADWSRFSQRRFIQQNELTRNDYVIVCGDFGIWHDTKEERYWLDWLSKKQFTILFVDGNHENFDRLNSGEFQLVDFLDGKAHKIRDNIYHLLRGYVFNINGKTVFAFGGAASHDIDDGILDEKDYDNKEDFSKLVKHYRKERKCFRINHVSWWKEEMPSPQEMELGRINLEKNNNKVDYIITHCCPQEIASIFSRGFYKPDTLTTFFNDVATTVDFDKWFFGHYHDDLYILDKYIMLYEQIYRID